MPSFDVLLRYVTMTQSGKVWLLREAYGAGLAVLIFWLARRGPSLKPIRLVFFLALPLVASRSFTSHAVAVKEDTMIAVVADLIHLIATGLWGGGLLALFWALYRGTKKMTLPVSWAAETVRRFSRLALGSVAVLLLTGLYQSWIQVGDLQTLFGTDYGRVLAFKLVIFIAMLGFGALNFFSTGPRLLRAAEQNTNELSLGSKGAFADRRGKLSGPAGLFRNGTAHCASPRRSCPASGRACKHLAHRHGCRPGNARAKARGRRQHQDHFTQSGRGV